jgi:DNA-binding IclR family transcriptional regulator
VLDAVGQPVAVVSIWGPGDRLTADHFAVLGPVVKAAADEISERQPASAR